MYMKNILRNPALKRIAMHHSIMLAGFLLVSACAGSGSTTQLPSENYNSRVSIIVIHHTSENFANSANILTQASSRPVSSHYLIPEPSDETYTRKKLEVFELVPESQRAWHAGRSYWGGKTALNDQSIGIELVNQTYCHRQDSEGDAAADAPNGDPNGVPDVAPESTAEPAEPPKQLCFFPDFAESQIDILLELLGDILERHPDIKPTNIVGHADIAPDRRVDPGPRFPWERLYQLGIGAWFDNETVKEYWERFIETPLPLVNVQRALSTYGYNVEDTGLLDEQTQHALRAFQMHFRPSLVSSAPNPESTAILYALIDKYHPDELDELLIIEGHTEDAVEDGGEDEPESDPAAVKQ